MATSVLRKGLKGTDNCPLCGRAMKRSGRKGALRLVCDRKNHQTVVRTGKQLAKPKTAGDISYKHLLRLIHRLPIVDSSTVVILTDETYKMLSYPYELREFLVRDLTNRYEYTPRFDCDEFSHVLFGAVEEWCSSLAFGIVHGLTKDGQAHALNVFYYPHGAPNGRFIGLEPQTDNMDGLGKILTKVWFLMM